MKKNGDLTEDGYDSVRVIMYDTIEDIMDLYDVRDDENEFIDSIVKTIRRKIESNVLMFDVDKNFWTEARIKAIVKPVIVGLIDKIEG